MTLTEQMKYPMPELALHGLQELEEGDKVKLVTLYANTPSNYSTNEKWVLEEEMTSPKKQRVFHKHCLSDFKFFLFNKETAEEWRKILTCIKSCKSRVLNNSAVEPYRFIYFNRGKQEEVFDMFSLELKVEKGVYKINLNCPMFNAEYEAQETLAESVKEIMVRWSEKFNQMMNDFAVEADEKSLNLYQVFFKWNGEKFEYENFCRQLRHRGTISEHKQTINKLLTKGAFNFVFNELESMSLAQHFKSEDNMIQVDVIANDYDIVDYRVFPNTDYALSFLERASIQQFIKISNVSVKLSRDEVYRGLYSEILYDMPGEDESNLLDEAEKVLNRKITNKELKVLILFAMGFIDDIKGLSAELKRSRMMLNRMDSKTDGIEISAFDVYRVFLSWRMPNFLEELENGLERQLNENDLKRLCFKALYRVTDAKIITTAVNSPITAMNETLESFKK